MIRSRSSNETQAEIETAAAAWLIRRRAGDGANEAFYAWLTADPRHGEAYDALALTMEDVGALDGLSALVTPRSRFTPRSIAAASVALAAAFVIGVVTLLTGTDDNVRLQTATAETRTVVLTDGSTVTLGADTQLRVRMTATQRMVTLDHGEAFFAVAHNTRRPFFVHADGAAVRVVGTRFDVRRGSAGVRVAVESGRVEVRDTQAVTLRGAVRVLRAGEATEVQDRPPYMAISAPPPPAERAPSGGAGAWRAGRLVYDDEPLSEIIADVRRHYAPGVRIADASLADLRVTAGFRVDEIPAFLKALEVTLPVDVTRAPDGEYVLAKDATPR